MKYAVSFIALCAASPVFAGSVTPFALVEAPIVAAPVAASITDWSGIYAGGMVSFDTGGRRHTNSIDEVIQYDLDPHTAFGGFAGYNIQKGAFVYGAELAYSTAGIGADAFPEYGAHDYFVDLKARAGFSIGKALVYGVVGGSFSRYDTVNGPTNLTGFNYGAGVDLMLSEHMFVGAEYLTRNMTGDDIGHLSPEARAVIHSAQIRVGYHF